VCCYRYWLVDAKTLKPLPYWRAVVFRLSAAVICWLLPEGSTAPGWLLTTPLLYGLNDNLRRSPLEHYFDVVYAMRVDLVAAEVQAT
jgi:hypothetical protein